MVIEKKTIKAWFKNLKKPTQEQFWVWLDSYWHKDELIPAKNIENLDNLLFDFSTKTEVENLTKSIASLQSQVNNLPKPSDYNLTKIIGDKFQFLKDGKLAQEIDLTKYVNEDDLPQIVKGELIDTSLVLTKSDDSIIVISLADLIIEPKKTGLQFLEPIKLSVNKPIKFDLIDNAYFYGFEVIGTANVSVGTSKTSIDNIGEIDSREMPILETGLKKVLSVWFQADTECKIEPIIYIKP